MSEHLSISWVYSGPPGERNLQCAPGRVIRNELDAYWCHWYYQGKSKALAAGKKYTLGPDKVALFQPGQFVEVEADPIEPTAYYWFGFRIAKYASGWPPREEWPIVREVPPNDIIRPLIEYIIRIGPMAGEQVSLAIESALEVFLNAFICGPADRAATAALAYPPPLQRALFWIQDVLNSNPSQKVTLDDMARVSGVCRSRLCRLFDERIGTSPLEVLYLYRITKSLSRLQLGHKTETIAADLGFSSAAHYTKRFEGLFGKSPTQMRRAMARGYKPKLSALHLPFMGE